MSQETEQALAPWEIEVLNIFVGLFDSFGLSKSVAQIYGVLFCAESAMTQEEVCRKLQISLGSASQGLRLLTDIGAVHRQSVPGQRGILFVPERSIRRLINFIIEAKVLPRMNTCKERLQATRNSVSKDDTLARSRLDALLQWERKATQLLPLVTKVLG